MAISNTPRPGYMYDGSQWVPIGLQAGVPSAKVQSTAPTSPATGDLWVDTSAAVSALDPSTLATQASVSSSINALPGHNLLDNGAFDVWQRGTGPFNPGSGEGYTADRWLVTGAGVVNRQRHPVGTAFRGTVPKYYLHMERGAAGNHPSLTQRVEDACTAAGQTVTMSFWVRAPQAWNAGSWQVGWVQYFGTGGSSYVADFGVHTFVPTADWQLVQATFTLPSVTGKSVNDSDSFLALMLRNNSSAATTGQLDVWGVKLEVGSAATAFQHKSFAEELAKCQRYFQCRRYTTAYAGIAVGWNYGTTVTRCTVDLPVQMVNPPTSSMTGSYPNGYTGFAHTNATKESCTFDVSGGSGLLLNGAFAVLAAADGTTVINFSADL